jgi:poly(3-hydroxybutyrate) depolymerase
MILLTGAWPAEAQLFRSSNLNRVNRKLAGRVVDYTHNHGQDNRIYSAILGMPRDLYVYLPPGYDPSKAYPLILYLHLAYIDENAFSNSSTVAALDEMIVEGCMPPVIVASPDGTYTGENRIRAPHSFFINGCGGRVEDHLLCEVVPFLMANYAIRPEREAHSLLGISAGAFGALSIAIRHRDFFGSVATLAAPANLRYSNTDGNYREDFDPATYRWKVEYDPNEVAGVFWFGLRRSRAKKYLEPVFGTGPEVVSRIASVNPADLIFTTDLHPGDLAIYLNYAGRDNWNFDAQVESFQWLAAQKGIAVTAECEPCARHNLAYFRNNQARAFAWLGRQLLPAAPLAHQVDGTGVRP